METIVQTVEFIPFDYQEECLSAIDITRNARKKAALVIMATGLGKTVIAAFDVKKQIAKKSSHRCLFLCHQNHILTQAKKRFETIIGNQVTYGFMHGNEKTFDSQILFASFQTMTNCYEKFYPQDFDTIIVDETHHVMAETYKPVLDYFSPEFLLGITATPDRGDEQDINEVYGAPVYTLNLPEALARNLLCPVEYKLMTDEISLQEVLEAPEGRFTMGRLNRMVFIPKRDQEIAAIIMKEMLNVPNPRVMIFCSSTVHAENMAELIEGAVPIHSKIGGAENTIRLELFREGMFPAASTVNMFNEAIDVPETNIEVFLRSTDSETVFFQQLGRGLRKHTSKEKVVVLDFVGNCERVKMIYDLYTEIKESEKKYSEKEWAKEPSSGKFFTLNVDSVDFQERIIPLLGIIQRITNRAAVEFYSTWQEASVATVKLQIYSQKEYYKEYAKDDRLPSNPRQYYEDFPGWNKFLCIDHYSTWQEAANAAQKLGFIYAEDYRRSYKKDRRLPSTPNKEYEDFPGWIVFLGRKSKKFYTSMKDASKAAVGLGITTQKEYYNRYTEDSMLNSSPHRFYKDFPGYPTFLCKK